MKLTLIINKNMPKVPNTGENRARCNCPNCPTYRGSDCPKKSREDLYCAKGKTICDLVKRGCICGECPVWDEYKLSVGYFCQNGVAE